jgi:hypothetical protein
MVSKRNQEILDCQNLELLSDLDKPTALSTLAAMEYSDILKLSYRQAIRLWAPLQRSRKGWKGSSAYVVATQPLDINAFKNRLSDLEDLWKEANKKGGSRYPSVEGSEYWYKARTQGSPDFIFSEDGTDLQWVGVGT